MKPLNLKLKNFFSHKNSDIDLSDMSSCLLVGNIEGDHSRSNGSGKSAIFEALPWVLFNNSRSSSKNDNIKWGQDSCKVELVFSHKEDKFRIVRERFRKSSTSSVNFFRENSIGEWTDLTKETATETNKYIVDVIGMDYKTFLNTVYFRQNDISEFANADPGRKKEIIKNIVDISRWDLYERKSKDKLKEFRIKHKILTEEMVSFDFIEEDYNETKNKLSQEKERFLSISEIKNSYIKNYEIALEEYLTKQSSLDTNLFDKTLEKIRYFSDMIVKNSNVIEKESESVKSLDSKKKKAESYCNTLSMKISSFAEEPNLDSRIDKIKKDIFDLKTEYRFKEMDLKSISEINENIDFCNHCNQKVSKKHLELVNKNNKIKSEKLSNNIKIMKKEMEFLSKEKKSLEINFAERNKVEVLKEKLSSAKEKLEFFESSVGNLNSNIESANSRVQEFIAKKKEQEKILASLKDSDFSNLKENLELSKKRKASAEEEELDVIKNIGAYEQELKSFEEKIEDYKERKKDIIKINKKIEVYFKLSKYFGKTGIQTVLLNNFIEDLEDETNKVVKNIGLPFSISIDTQSVGSKGDVKETLDINIRKDGHYHKFDSLSGGEKAKIALSLRFGLSSLSSRYGGGDFEFLMLDEINSPLDRDGVENLMVSIINSLEEHLLVLMITHDESLKESFNDILEVTKVNGESFIKLTKT